MSSMVEEQDNNFETEVPMCSTCGHKHVQGSKCPVCGHVGRSQILQKMKIRANEARKIGMKSYQGSMIQSDVWEVVKEMRNMIFCREMSIPFEVEFSDINPSEAESVHVLGTAGNAPIFVARYRTVQYNESYAVIHIDRLAVLPNYRGRGLAKQCLKYIYEEVLRSIGALVIISLEFTTYFSSPISSKLLSLGFQATTVDTPAVTTIRWTFPGDVLQLAKTRGDI